MVRQLILVNHLSKVKLQFYWQMCWISPFTTSEALFLLFSRLLSSIHVFINIRKSLNFDYIFGKFTWNLKWKWYRPLNTNSLSSIVLYSCEMQPLWQHWMNKCIRGHIISFYCYPPSLNCLQSENSSA